MRQGMRWAWGEAGTLVGSRGVTLLLSLVLAVGTVLLPVPPPAQADAPTMTGLAYAAEQDCRADQKPGASKGRPTGAAPSAACGSGPMGASTGQPASPPRRLRPAAGQVANAGRPRNTADQRP